jgi:cytochrome c2
VNSSVTFYAKVLGLFALLTAVVGINLAVWGLHRHPTPPVLFVSEANSTRGRVLIQEYGCGACHVVPEVRGAVGRVGPRLDRVKEQIYIAGTLPNTPQNLVFWITNPKKADPQTAMPDLGVSEKDARDIAAYLYRHP